MMFERYISMEKGNVFYWTNENKTSDYAVVFLHGLMLDHTLFDSQVSCFEDKYKLISWDNPGYGKSRPYGDLSSESAVDALKNILLSEGVKQAVLVGHSMGGYVAQAFIKRYPDMVKGFVAVDTTPFGKDYCSEFDQWCMRQTMWNFLFMPYEIVKMYSAGLCSFKIQTEEKAMASFNSYTRKEFADLMYAGYQSFIDENCDLKIECPVMIIVGEYDIFGKVRQYCRAWHEKTGYPLHIISRAAHNSNVDNSESVNDKLEAFIRDLK